MLGARILSKVAYLKEVSFTSILVFSVFLFHLLHIDTSVETKVRILFYCPTTFTFLKGLEVP